MHQLKSKRGLFLLLFSLVAIYATMPSSAYAFRTHVFQSKFEVPGVTHFPAGIAVNQTTHHFYVANSGSGRVYNFTSPDELDPITPELTGAPDLERPFTLAVDNSGGATDGNIWVGQLGPGLVQQFDSAGAATPTKITASSLPPDGTPQGGGLPPVVNNGGFSPIRVAVDSAGNVFVADSRSADSSRAIEEFSSSGTFVAQFDAGLAGEVEGIAIDDLGDIYLAYSEQEPAGSFGPGLLKLGPTGECMPAGCAPLDPTPMYGLALDRETATLLTTERPTLNQGRFVEFDSEGNELGSSGEAQLTTPYSIAVDEESGRVFVGNIVTGGSGGSINIYGPALFLPDATTEAATAVSDRGATFHGLIGAAEGPPATCTFQYVDDEGFQAEGFAGAASAPCEPAGPFTGTTSEAVEAVVTGLVGGTTYHFRLLGTNESGSHPGAAEQFTTRGPQVRGESVTQIGETEATLNALVNPRGGETAYAFEYVSQAQFEAGGYADAMKVPIGGQSIGAGSGDVAVSQHLGGLAPGTTYHFRAVATSTTGAVPGTSTGEDAIFATYGRPSGLPDGRAYEQASPVDKDGTNIQSEPNAVEAAADGNAVTFFTNSGIPGGTGAQQFPSYLATRSSSGDGWSTQGLLPPATSGPFGKVLGWSEDLSQTYVSDKRVGSPGSLYDRASSDGSLTEIASGGEAEADAAPYPFFLAALSQDGNQVLFENNSAQLQPEAAAGQSNVYVWDRASHTLKLASVFNNGTAPASGSYAGPYAWFQGNGGAGGAQRGYYTEAEHTISADGRLAFFTDAETKKVYVRENPIAAQSPVNGAGECTNPALACTTQISAAQDGLPESSAPAAFIGAGADGHYAYFLSGAKLTATATVGSLEVSQELYRYDTETRGLEDISSDPTSSNGAPGSGRRRHQRRWYHRVLRRQRRPRPGRQSGKLLRPRGKLGGNLQPLRLARRVSPHVRCHVERCARLCRLVAHQSPGRGKDGRSRRPGRHRRRISAVHLLALRKRWRARVVRLPSRRRLAAVRLLRRRDRPRRRSLARIRSGAPPRPAARTLISHPQPLGRRQPRLLPDLRQVGLQRHQRSNRRL